MEICLKNGENIKIEISPLYLEYLDDYDGGINKLISDWKQQKNQLYITNFFVYAMIASCLSHPINYRDALKMIKMEDFDRVVIYLSENFEKVEKFTTLEPKIKHF